MNRIIQALLITLFIIMTIPNLQNWLYPHLNRHPNRFNELYGAGLALEKSGDAKKASHYYEQLLAITNSSVSDRPQMETIALFFRNNK